MIRRPPRSTLFPYTRSSDLEDAAKRLMDYGFHAPTISWPRSEEHTSELQSQSNLVCRLLLEKKKELTCVLLALMWHAYSVVPALLHYQRLVTSPSPSYTSHS